MRFSARPTWQPAKKHDSDCGAHHRGMKKNVKEEQNKVIGNAILACDPEMDASRATTSLHGDAIMSGTMTITAYPCRPRHQTISKISVRGAYFTVDPCQLDP